MVCFKGPGESFIGVLLGASHEILHCQNRLLNLATETVKK